MADYKAKVAKQNNITSSTLIQDSDFEEFESPIVVRNRILNSVNEVKPNPLIL